MTDNVRERDNVMEGSFNHSGRKATLPGKGGHFSPGTEDLILQ